MKLEELVPRASGAAGNLVTARLTEHYGTWVVVLRVSGDRSEEFGYQRTSLLVVRIGNWISERESMSDVGKVVLIYSFDKATSEPPPGRLLVRKGRRASPAGR